MMRMWRPLCRKYGYETVLRRCEHGMKGSLLKNSLLVSSRHYSKMYESDDKSVYKSTKLTKEDQKIFNSILELVERNPTVKVDPDSVSQDEASRQNFMKEILLRLEESGARTRSTVKKDQDSGTEEDKGGSGMVDSGFLVVLDKFVECVQKNVKTDWDMMEYLRHVLQQFNQRNKTLDARGSVVEPVATDDIYVLPEPLILTVPYLVPRLIGGTLGEDSSWPASRQLQMYEMVVDCCLHGAWEHPVSHSDALPNSSRDMSAYVAVCNAVFYNGLLRTHWRVHRDAASLQQIVGLMGQNGLTVSRETEKFLCKKEF